MAINSTQDKNPQILLEQKNIFTSFHPDIQIIQAICINLNWYSSIKKTSPLIEDLFQKKTLESLYPKLDQTEPPQEPSTLPNELTVKNVEINNTYASFSDISGRLEFLANCLKYLLPSDYENQINRLIAKIELKREDLQEQLTTNSYENLFSTNTRQSFIKGLAISYLDDIVKDFLVITKDQTVWSEILNKVKLFIAEENSKELSQLGKELCPKKFIAICTILVVALEIFSISLVIIFVFYPTNNKLSDLLMLFLGSFGLCLSPMIFLLTPLGMNTDKNNNMVKKYNNLYDKESSKPHLKKVIPFIESRSKKFQDSPQLSTFSLEIPSPPGLTH